MMAAVSTSVLAKSKKDTTEVVPFDRGIGISRSIFVPKGSIMFGTSVSYATYDVGNFSNTDSGFNALFGLVSGLKGNVVTGGVSPHVSYFLIDNLSIGGRFNFKRSKFDIENVDLGTADMNFKIARSHYIKDAYNGSVFVRYYIPFGTSRRFAMFAELAASGGYAEAQTYNYDEHNEKHGTHQDIYDFEIGVIPGITAFVTNNLALEVSVGLVGLNYQKIVQRTDQVHQSVMESSGANYKINILNISLGISVCIPTGAHSAKKVKVYKQLHS